MGILSLDLLCTLLKLDHTWSKLSHCVVCMYSFLDFYILPREQCIIVTSLCAVSISVLGIEEKHCRCINVLLKEKMVENYSGGYRVGFPSGSDGRESTCCARDPGSILVWEDPLEKGMATHSSILAWGIPWKEEPGSLWFMGLKRVEYNQRTNIYSHRVGYEGWARTEGHLKESLPRNRGKRTQNVMGIGEPCPALGTFP